MWTLSCLNPTLSRPLAMSCKFTQAHATYVLGLIIGFFLAVGCVSSFLLPGPVQGPKKNSGDQAYSTLHMGVTFKLGAASF